MVVAVDRGRWTCIPDSARPGDLDALVVAMRARELGRTPIVVSRFDRPPDEMREVLAGRVSALIGHSGVGKSTLVNALVPDADRAVGRVSGIGKGRHTSSSAVAIPLPGGGWVVDTPGVRSF